MKKICLYYLSILAYGCSMKQPTAPVIFDFQEELTPNISSNFQDQEQEKIELESETQERLDLQKEIVRNLDQKLQKLENILQKKEQEITTLKNNQQTIASAQTQQQEQVQLIVQNKLITTAIEKDLTQTFRVNSTPLNFEIGANKKVEVVPKNDQIQKQILQIQAKPVKKFSVEKQILNIKLTTIQPHILLTPPFNPIILTRVSGSNILYKKAYNNFLQKNYTNAIDEFHKYIAKYPQDTAIDNAFFWIGVAYWHQKNYEIAQKYFAYILQNFKFTSTNKGGKTADAMIMLGRISKQPENSKKYYQKVIELYPQSNSSKTAKKLLQKLP